MDSHQAELSDIGNSEGALFSCELPVIQSCEKALSQRSLSPADPVSNMPALPMWVERPGATEAVSVGGDLRSRYNTLQANAATRCDEVEHTKCTCVLIHIHRFSGCIIH